MTYFTHVDSLAHYSWLKVLDLSENFIEVLESNTFLKLTRLKKLNLTSNRLNRIDDYAFKGDFVKL